MMRPICCAFLVSATLASAAQAPAAQAPHGRSNPATVYVIPVRGMIERALVYVIRRGVTQAVRENADAVILDMDTTGGRVDAAKDIVDILDGLRIRSCTFVNSEAISAGAIIALATDEIYMAPTSRIGDAMPILLSPLGAPQAIPESIQEKTTSYVAGLIRSVAQRRNHDAALAEAMVRPGVEYKIGDDVINAAGRILTLTGAEAERMVDDGRGGKRRLLSRGTVSGIGPLLETLGLRDCRIVEFRVTWAEKVARYIEMLSVLFLVAGALGLYIEFKTPGFGLPGIAGIILLSIWFWGHHVAGLAGGLEVLLFAVGAALIAVEIFVLPGFGFVGVAGVALMLLAAGMAMVQHMPGTPAYQVPAGAIQSAVLKIGMTLGGVLLAGGLLSRYLPETRMFRRVALMGAMSRGEGFSASPPTDELVGLHGVAASALRPAGIGVFGERRIDVITRGEFLEPGTPIVVAEAHGNRVVVDATVSETTPNR